MTFQIARAARPTGLLLQSLVIEGLGGANLNGVVCYGVGYSGSSPALNARCSAMDKLQQAHVLRAALSANAILPLSHEEAVAAVRNRPVLGRNIQHTKGKDIRLCLEDWQVGALAGISDFFTPYMHSTAEYRTWVYRRRHLGTYMKELAEPARMRRVGRNYDNGFRFVKVQNDDVPEELKDLARRSIATLRLDFGAIDAIRTPDGSFVVLEVNSAPGVADARRSVIQKLAHRIVRWAQEGTPQCRYASIIC